MEVTVKVMVSKKGEGYIRFYGSVSAIPSSVVRVSTFVELVAEYRIYCRMIKEFGYTVDVRRPNLYSAFVNSRPEVESTGNRVHLSEVAFWPEGLKAEDNPSLSEFNKSDKEFLKALHITVED